MARYWSIRRRRARSRSRRRAGSIRSRSRRRATEAQAQSNGKKCLRKVTAQRIDSGGGWGMNLKFKCDDKTVNIGNSSTNKLTSSAGVFINKNSCPQQVNKSNWSTNDRYKDKFNITVGDCIN